jgi:hypothetical protein
MAPEQMIRGGKIDNRTDICAFGVILFEVICGKSLYEGYEVTTPSCYQLLKDPQFVLGRLKEENVPPYITYIVTKCTKFESAERYQVMDQVVGALDLAVDVEKHYFAENVVLLTRRSSDDVVTLADEDFEVAEQEVGEAEAADVEDTAKIAKISKRKKWSKIAISLSGALVILVLIVRGVYFGVGGGFSREDNRTEKVAGNDTSQKAVNGSVAKPQTLFQEAVDYCKKTTPEVIKNDTNLAYCVRRRAWRLFKQGDDGKAEVITKETIKFFWATRKWKKKIKTKEYISLNYLLSRIHRKRQNEAKKRGEDWRPHAKAAAHYEATVNYWRKKIKK